MFCDNLSLSQKYFQLEKLQGFTVFGIRATRGFGGPGAKQKTSKAKRVEIFLLQHPLE